jgi:pimeloyl-ACP methyl ester carboxylesterase
MRPLLNALLYFPSRTIEHSPADAGLAYRDLWFETDDGERLHGWWVKRRAAALGHVLLCHGNAGNVGDRVLHATVLTAVGFDVLLFDYRGYGHSSGTPGEQGTYRDARGALACLLRQPDVDSSRVLYLGESLGGAVAIELAFAHPPAGLVLLRQLLEEVRGKARAAGNARVEAGALAQLGQIAKGDGRPEDAVALLEASSAAYQRGEAPHGEAQALGDLANALDDLGRRALSSKRPGHAELARDAGTASVPCGRLRLLLMRERARSASSCHHAERRASVPARRCPPRVSSGPDARVASSR